MTTADHYDDRLLLMLIAEGDEHAFRLLFSKYAPVLYKKLFRFLKSRQTREDIVQETFMMVWLYRDELPGIRNWQAWLYRIAYNRALTLMRDEALHQKKLDKLAEPAAPNQTEQDVELHILKDLIATAVSRLSPQQKKIYLFSREEGLPIAAISERLSLSPQTIKNNLGLALKSIRLFVKANGHHILVLTFLLH